MIATPPAGSWAAQAWIGPIVFLERGAVVTNRATSNGSVGSRIMHIEGIRIEWYAGDSDVHVVGTP